MLPTDSGGETYLEHVANAVQPLLNLIHAPSLFTAAESREIVEGSRLRLERALEILYLAKGDT